MRSLTIFLILSTVLSNFVTLYPTVGVTPHPTSASPTPFDVSLLAKYNINLTLTEKKCLDMCLFATM